MPQNRELWERQPWDTDLGFKVFQKWLHQLQRPRNLNEAWREYLGKELTPDGRAIGIPSHVRQMAKAEDENSKKFPFSCSWEDRARAFDAKVQLDEQEMWQHRRDTLKKTEWDLAHQLIAKAQEMLNWPIYQRTEEINEGKTLIIYKPSLWSMRDISAFAKIASELARLAADMEQSHLRVDFNMTLDPETLQAIKVLEQHGIARSVLFQEFNTFVRDQALKLSNN